MKINNFRGDLSDISSKTATLLLSLAFHPAKSVRATVPRGKLMRLQNYLYLCFNFRGCIGYVTPKTVYFHCAVLYLLDQRLPNNIQFYSKNKITGLHMLTCNAAHVPKCACCY